jgi:hypothetical protein
MDERDSPLANTFVVVDLDQGARELTTHADSSGHYEFGFETHQTQFMEARDTVGLVRAWRDGGEYESDVQLVPSGTADILKSLRLRRVRPITAGQSITMSIEPDSTLCFDWDIDFSLTTRCETVQFLAGTAATVTVEARPAEAGGVIPTVEIYGEPVVPAPRTISFPVQAGKVYRIRVRIPTEMAPQRYVISTSASH